MKKKLILSEGASWILHKKEAVLLNQVMTWSLGQLMVTDPRMMMDQTVQKMNRARQT
jgi:hypothetical protein